LDVDENIGLERGGAAREVRELVVFADLGRNFEPADIARPHQKIGAEIAADEIMAAMDELIIGTVETTPDFIAPGAARVIVQLH
jgi:hypothetical protein